MNKYVIKRELTDKEICGDCFQQTANLKSFFNSYFALANLLNIISKLPADTLLQKESFSEISSHTETKDAKDTIKFRGARFRFNEIKGSPAL